MLEPTEAAHRLATAPYPPEIATARRLVDYHTALGWPTVALQVSLLRELLGSIDYLLADRAAARRELAAVHEQIGMLADELRATLDGQQ